MTALKCALCCAAVFAVSLPVSASPPLETDTIVGLMAKANPKMASDRKSIESLARFVWCHEFAPLQNQFQREDYLNALTERVTSLGANSLGTIEGMYREFGFYDYDFKTETLQIKRGDYDWARTAPVGNFLTPQNRPCWANPGNMFSFTPIVEALPDWNKIPYRIQIPKEKARALFEHGNPKAVLTFSMKVERFTVEPMGSPKYIFRGPTTEWELIIVDGAGAEARRFASEERELHKALPFTAPQAKSPDPLKGSRIATAGINVREQPSTTATLMSTLGPNTVFEIEEQSPDGQWSRIDAPPIVRGWANNVVLLKSSMPNGSTDASAPPAETSTLQPPPAPDENTHTKNVKLLATGIPDASTSTYEEYRNGYGVLTKKQTSTFSLESSDACILTLTTTVKAQENDYADHWKETTSSYKQRFNFRKMKAIKATYQNDPWEAVLYGFAGGDSNPKLTHKPRMTTLVEFHGEGALCGLKDDGTDNYCSSDTSSTNDAYPNPAARPKQLRAAFDAVKLACK